MGMRTGFQIRSIDQAMCITKLVYYDLGSFIPELCRFVSPEAITKFTATTITEAGLDPDNPKWINYLGTAYTEAYAQWLDSLGNRLRGDIVEEWKDLIVVNNKSQVATRERKITDALNIIGTSIDRAVKITNIATREEFRNRKAHRLLVFHAWVDKELAQGKMRKRLDTANLPWKEFKDYPKPCFPSKRSEYDVEGMNDTWDSELKYHNVEPLTVGRVAAKGYWMLKEVFLGWAACYQSAKDNRQQGKNHRA